MWILYAALSAVTAALVTIFAKIGLVGVDSTLATTIRGVLMGVMLVIFALGTGVFRTGALASISFSSWMFVALSAAAGASSWLLYFLALKAGPASAVAVIDKSSVVLIILFAALFLGETITLRAALGIVFTVLGTLLILFK